MTKFRYKTHSCTSLNALLARFKFFRIVFTWVAPSNCDDTINILLYFLRHDLWCTSKDKNQGGDEYLQSLTWIIISSPHWSNMTKAKLADLYTYKFIGWESKLYGLPLLSVTETNARWIFSNVLFIWRRLNFSHSGDLSVVYCPRLKKDVTV